jgi:hypothetical protein
LTSCSFGLAFHSAARWAAHGLGGVGVVVGYQATSIFSSGKPARFIPCRQWSRHCLRGRKRSFRFGQSLELGLPALLQTASNETVLRLAQMKGTLCSTGLIACPFYLQLKGAACPGLPFGDHVSRRQAQGYLFAGDRLTQPAADRGIRLESLIDIGRPVKDILSRGEIERLEDTACTERDKLIISVFGDTGMRVGELVRLRTEDQVSGSARISCMCGGSAISTGWYRL